MNISDKHNGSVDLLAQAMRQVFDESMQGVRSKVKQGMENMESRITTHFDKQIETTNQNMQTQFAEQEKDIADIVDKKFTQETND